MLSSPTRPLADDLKSQATRRIPRILRQSPKEWIGLVTRSRAGDLYWDLIAEGTRARVAFEPRRLVEVALKRDAQEILLFHNHPSGQREPSRADLKLTSQVAELAVTLDFPLQGHGIVTLDHVDWI